MSVRNAGASFGAELDDRLVLDVSSSEDVAPELEYQGRNGTWLSGVDVANTTRARDFVVAGKKHSYSFGDAATTSGATALTSAAEGNFSSKLVGYTVTGPGIPTGTTVAAVVSSTELTLSAAATATQTGARVTLADPADGLVDFFYIRHRGGQNPNIGIGPGATPPPEAFRFAVACQSAADGSEDAVGGVCILAGATQTGDLLAFCDALGVPVTWVDADRIVEGADAITSSSWCVRENSGGRSLTILNAAGSASYGFTFSFGSLRLRSFTAGADIWQADGAGLAILGNVGFYGTGAQAKPTITGSKGGNAALSSLITALATLGLVTDSTT